MLFIKDKFTEIRNYFKVYLENKKREMEQDLQTKISNWARLVYSGTTYGKSTELLVYNDKYALFHKKPSTEYVGRMTGSVYGEAIYFVLNLFQKDVSHIREKMCLYYKEGRLLREDKEKLETEFNLFIPKKDTIKKLTEDIWVVVLNNSTNGFYEFFESDLQIHKLVRKTANSIEVDVNEVKRSYSRTKYSIKEFTVEEEAVKAFLHIKTMMEEYNDLINRKRQKLKDINNIFK